MPQEQHGFGVESTWTCVYAVHAREHFVLRVIVWTRSSLLGIPSGEYRENPVKSDSSSQVWFLLLLLLLSLFLKQCLYQADSYNFPMDGLHKQGS